MKSAPGYTREWWRDYLAAKMKRQLTRTEADTFRVYADALSTAGDRFRGRGRVVYEDAMFRVEFEVNPDDHLHGEIQRWVDVTPGWTWQSLRSDRVVIQWREPQ